MEQSFTATTKYLRAYQSAAPLKLFVAAELERAAVHLRAYQSAAPLKPHCRRDPGQ